MQILIDLLFTRERDGSDWFTFSLTIALHRPDRVAALRQLIKDAQQFYADEMDRHGFRQKNLH